MNKPQKITSRHNPLVARFRAAAHGGDRDRMLLDGAHLVRDALAAGLVVHDLIVLERILEHDEVRDLIGRANAQRVAIKTATPAVLAAMSPVRSSTGVVALAARPAIDAAQILSLRDPCVVIAAGVQDPGNVGAIVRVAEAGGATGVIVAGLSADPFSWKALRGAMGSSLRLPVAVVEDAGCAVDDARSRGCSVVAAVPRGGGSLFEADFKRPWAILIGGEGAGLGSLVDRADRLVTIPMQPRVESLNVAVAAALIVYEARRQTLAGRKSEVESHKSGVESRKSKSDDRHELANRKSTIDNRKFP